MQAGDSPIRSRDPILDAWRGLSVLLVIISHLIGNEVAFSRLGLPWDVHLPHGFAVNHFDHYIGQVGVQFFFVISGYIITTLMLREQRRHGRVSLSAFYIRRAFRILPPLCLTLTITLILTSLGYIAVNPTSFYLASTFLCDVRFNECGWFAGHTWSLAVEEQFYLVWPLLLVALRFRSIARVAWSLTVGLVVLEQLFFSTGEFGIDNAMSFACIAMGCLYATSEPLRDWIARAAGSVALFALACVLILANPWMPNPMHLHRLLNLAHPLLIGFVLFACFRYRPFLQHQWPVRALAGIGLVSYGLYLWQQLFLGEAVEYLRPSPLHFAPLCGVMVVLSYFAFEKPLMAVGARLSRQFVEDRRASDARPSKWSAPDQAT